MTDLHGLDLPVIKDTISCFDPGDSLLPMQGHINLADLLTLVQNA